VKEGEKDTHVLDAREDESVAEVKSKLASVMQGSPNAAFIQLVHAGRVRTCMCESKYVMHC
jgi:hypothetical protein